MFTLPREIPFIWARGIMVEENSMMTKTSAKSIKAVMAARS